jgi:hypothetical protein
LKEIAMTNLTALERNLKTIDGPIAATDDAQRRAMRERGHHFNRFNFESPGNLPSRISARYGYAVHRMSFQHFAQQFTKKGSRIRRVDRPLPHAILQPRDPRIVWPASCMHHDWQPSIERRHDLLNHLKKFHVSLTSVEQIRRIDRDLSKSVVDCAANLSLGYR